MATQRSEPEYERTLLELLPPQGRWDDDAYLWLTERTARLLELADGRIEVLPMPTDEHQDMLQTLFLALLVYTQAHGGKAHFAPLRLRIRAGKFREPDLLLLRDATDPRRSNRFWSGADLVVEVVSPDGAERDLTDKVSDHSGCELTDKVSDHSGCELTDKVSDHSGCELTDKVSDHSGCELTDKVFDYAEAGIPEYWIVDPASGTITMLQLAGDRYHTHGVFGRGMTATVATLPGFAVSVGTVLDAR